MDDILVSVLMLTFQHGAYIKKALDSILEQEVDFNYEIIIGDDCSTDETRDIIQKYALQHQGKFCLVFHTIRQGPVKNYASLLKHVRGKYIACLEGDDYWNHPFKLMKQIDFLEKNPQYSAVFHDISVLGNQINVANIYKKDIDSADEYLQALSHIPSCSLVHRTSCLKGKEPFFQKNYYIGDRIVHAFLIQNGCIKFLDEKMAVYRHITHRGTSFSAKKEDIIIQEGIMAIQLIGKILKKEKLADKKIKEIKRGYLEQLFWQNQLWKMFQFWLISIYRKIFY